VDSRIRMGVQTHAACKIESQFSVFNWSVREFAGIPQRELVDAGFCDRKANGIPIATRGDMRAGCGVSEIAKLPDVGVGRG
jgi:hypothetical protein